MDLRSQKRRSILAVNSSTALETQQAPVQEKPPTRPDYRVKLVTVGDGGTGKTCMLIRYLKGKFDDAYVPTIFENYAKLLKKDGKVIELALWDTAGQEEYDRLRALSYPETDVVLVCYSVEDAISLENAFDKWVPEIQTYCPGVPYILVGCKADSPNRAITAEFGMEMAIENGAHAFIECSSKTGEGIEDPFGQAIRAVLKPHERYILKQQRRKQQEAAPQKQAKRKISYPNYQKVLKTKPSGQLRTNPTGSNENAAAKASSDAQKQQPKAGCCVIL